MFKQTCPVIQVLLLLLPVEKDLEFAENMIVALALTLIGVRSGADHGPQLCRYKMETVIFFLLPLGVL